MDGAPILARLDQAFLKLDASAQVNGLRQEAEDALEHGFRSLCVPPVLAGTVKKNFPALRVAAVVAYPLGLDTICVKETAIRELIELGVDEVDVVYDLFALVNDNWSKLEKEADVLGRITESAGTFHKAIIEAPILSEEQLRRAAEVLVASPVDCIKTSTGYHREPTSLEQVRLLRQVASSHKQIKASGGIRSLYDVKTMLDAGADIIGTSSGVNIARELVASRD